MLSSKMAIAILSEVSMGYDPIEVRTSRALYKYNKNHGEEKLHLRDSASHEGMG